MVNFAGNCFYIVLPRDIFGRFLFLPVVLSSSYPHSEIIQCGLEKPAASSSAALYLHVPFPGKNGDIISHRTALYL